MGIEPVSLNLNARDPDAFARALGGAFERSGFAVVCDHGLKPDLIQAANDEAKAFFALPDETKRAYVVPGGAGQRGYTPFGREAAKGADSHDLKEFWHVGRDLPPGHPLEASMPPNLWPAERPAFRPATTALYAALDAFGVLLLGAIARHLALDDAAFTPAVDDGNSILRLLHYPPVTVGAPGVRAAAHEDINAITLLLGAEEAGLELLDRDGRWIAVKPPPGSIVCNIGDMLQRLTNDVLPSTTHRVVNPTRERASLSRYSMPFFLHFRPDFVIKTLPGCVTPGRPDRYPEPITADTYLHQRLKEIRLA